MDIKFISSTPTKPKWVSKRIIELRELEELEEIEKPIINFRCYHKYCIMIQDSIDLFNFFVLCQDCDYKIKSDKQNMEHRRLFNLHRADFICPYKTCFFVKEDKCIYGFITHRKPKSIIKPKLFSRRNYYDEILSNLLTNFEFNYETIQKIYNSCVKIQLISEYKTQEQQINDLLNTITSDILLYHNYIISHELIASPILNVIRKITENIEQINTYLSLYDYDPLFYEKINILCISVNNLIKDYRILIDNTESKDFENILILKKLFFNYIISIINENIILYKIIEKYKYLYFIVLLSYKT